MSKIFKLNTISILLQDISISENMILTHLFPIFKLEIWLGDILLDETYSIIVSNLIETNTVSLEIGAKPFRYFPKQLFNRSKIARLKIILLRGNQNWSQSQELQTFNLVLSEYSYDYCRNRYNEFREHSLGVSKKTFLYYKIQCEYQSQFEPKQLLPIEDKYEAKQLFKQFQQPKDKTDHSSLKKSRNNSQMVAQFLPNYLFPLEADQKMHASSVFIDLQAMRPVYRHESMQGRKLRIRIESSYLNAESGTSQQNSVLKQNKHFVESTSSFLNALYYFYVLICLVLVIIQMSPSKKV